ncbi:MAG: cytochrome c oxidase subunit II [Actinomycetota bacterium]|nr:cytochrome c oxidase subunit II [Actinomycetota bacterium]
MTELVPERVQPHGRRIFGIWLVLTAISVPLIVLVLGPHLPPGNVSAEAGSQRDANVLLTALLVPIALLVWVYFAYSLAVFRNRGEAIVDGPPLKGHADTQLLWIVLTSVIVLALAVWGSYTLIVSSHGAGGGQGPDPIALPNGHQHALPIQVIGQQWEWTFRYPTYGGLETRDIAIPANTLVAFHVTSIDVTHSFWAYELGVKADAVPGVDNIAYVTAHRTGFFQIRCAELCGLWHGHMSKKGRILSDSAFQAWIAAAQKRNAAVGKYLPKYNHVYFPAPLRRAG